MAQYRVKETSYINDKIVEPGEIVEYAGIPGPNLELVNPSDAKKAQADAEAALRAEATRIGAQLRIPGANGAPDTWRALTADDPIGVVQQAISDTKIYRTD